MSEEKRGMSRAGRAEIAASLLQQRLFDRFASAHERRRREEEWLASLLRTKVIRFSDVQIAAEFLARHRWEDATRIENPGAPNCFAALQRLCMLRARREGWSDLSSPQALPPPDDCA